MAITLSKTNIATGNIITAAEVSQSVDAFTGAVAYDITLSGSLQLTGSVRSRNGYTGSLQGTASFVVSSSYALSSSYAVSSSRAVSSSYALTATSANSVSNQYYDGDAFLISTFNFVAGKVVLTSGVGSSSVFPVLAGKRISREAFITATYADGFVFNSPTEPANLMTSVTPDGRVTVIQQSGALDNGNVVFTGIYI
jgi:hypothetical protein